VSRRPVPAAKVVAAVLSVAVLSGCGSGLHAMTYKATGRQDGSSANVGGARGIAVRHLHVAPPAAGSTHDAGGSALVLAGLSNGGDGDDALVSASSPAAASAALTVDGRDVPEVPLVAGRAAPAGFAVRLDGLLDELHVGESVEVTLVFRDAGRVTLTAPLLPGDNGLGEREQAQDPYGAHE